MLFLSCSGSANRLRLTFGLQLSLNICNFFLGPSFGITSFKSSSVNDTNNWPDISSFFKTVAISSPTAPLSTWYSSSIVSPSKWTSIVIVVRFCCCKPPRQSHVYTCVYSERVNISEHRMLPFYIRQCVMCDWLAVTSLWLWPLNCWRSPNFNSSANYTYADSAHSEWVDKPEWLCVWFMYNSFTVQRCVLLLPRPWVTMWWISYLIVWEHTSIHKL